MTDSLSFCLLVGFWEVGLQEQVFYTLNLRQFAGEEFCGEPGAENLAVRGGVTSGVVELAVGIILVLVPGPGVSGGFALLRVDGVVMFALDVFPFTMKSVALWRVSWIVRGFSRNIHFRNFDLYQRVFLGQSIATLSFASPIAIWKDCKCAFGSVVPS
ncbi:hypothetical protein Bca4012_058440 [Brassica carinata]